MKLYLFIGLGLIALCYAGVARLETLESVDSSLQPAIDPVVAHVRARRSYYGGYPFGGFGGYYPGYGGYCCGGYYPRFGGGGFGSAYASASAHASSSAGGFGFGR